MTKPSRHELDEAIDRVAAKLVEASADDQLLTRTVAQLPMRSATPWFLTWPAQATMAAALLLAMVYAGPSGEPAPSESMLVRSPTEPPEAQPLAISGPATPIPVVRSRIPDPRSLIPDPPRPDHDHSLAPVQAMEAMVFESIAPAALEPDAAVVLTPLAVTELVLMGESPPP